MIEILNIILKTGIILAILSFILPTRMNPLNWLARRSLRKQFPNFNFNE